MKKLTTLFVLLVSSIFSFGQFHFELGINGSIPAGTLDVAHDIGVGVFVEPKYRLSEKLDVGLFYGRNAFMGLSVEEHSYGVSTVSPLLVTLTYKNQDKEVTPYLGVGVGLYQVNSLLEIDSAVVDPFLKSTEFGFAPKIGMYLDFFNIGIAYHVAQRAQYFQLHFGIRILYKN